MKIILNYIKTSYMNKTCDKCSAIIPQGNPYICITHNIEFINRDYALQQDFVQIMDSDEILVLCGRCGNHMTKAAMKQMLKAVPASYDEIRSN